jgi:formylglycine-generating enzyme required for sulfatase activity
MERPGVTHDVMISYATRDVKVATAICAALEERKIRCWIAPRDIPPGDDYGAAIIHAIDAARVFVLVFSGAANESKPVAHELERAAFGRAELRIITFKIEDRAISPSLILFINRFQILDAVGRPQDAAIQELIERVSQILHEPSPTPPPQMGRNWKRIVLMIVAFILLAASAVVSIILLRPTSIVPKNQQTQSEPAQSPKKHDRPESSPGGPATAARKSASPLDPAVADIRLPMVPLAAGKFLMGSPTSEHDRDISESQHEVSVAAFWMDPTEVTNAAFQKFLIANAKWQKPQVKPDFVDDEYLRNWKNADYPFGEHGNYPVTRVSWYAAQAYCTWMKKRLPTEAEWEYAARAGTTKAYWWGDEWSPASAAGNSERGPDPVGKQAHRNQWNLFDMLGNVKEWTNTVYKPYPYDASDGREDPQSVSARTVRGGSWADTPEYIRAAFRISKAPNFTDGLVGFRCASSTRGD